MEKDALFIVLYLPQGRNALFQEGMQETLVSLQEYLEVNQFHQGKEYLREKRDGLELHLDVLVLEREDTDVGKDEKGGNRVEEVSKEEFLEGKLGDYA